MTEGVRIRNVLFLQGPSSHLFRYIADALEARGVGVFRINICAGDRVFWRRSGATSYTGTAGDWPAFLDGFVERRHITEIVLLGEERPYHRAAAEVASARSIPVFAIEMGYFRPDWISIERDGSGSNSHFPTDPEAILRAASALPEPDFGRRYSQSFAAEVAYDLAYNLPNVFLGFLHPHYRWHAISHPLAEYWSWLRRFAAAGRRRRATAAVLHRLEETGARYFLYPLQLQTDYQIRAHSPFYRQEQAIEQVLAAFAGYAPPDTNLVLKTHPLDNGLVDWTDVATAKARTLGVQERVHILHGGDLASLIGGSEGVVTINSTVGIQALRQGRAVKVLGTAIYDIEGLTDTRSPELFFAGPAAPDPAVRSAFLRLLAAGLHERGNFYSRAGARAAAISLAARIEENRVNEPGAYAAIAPRSRPEKIGSRTLR